MCHLGLVLEKPLMLQETSKQEHHNQESKILSGSLSSSTFIYQIEITLVNKGTKKATGSSRFTREQAEWICSRKAGKLTSGILTETKRTGLRNNGDGLFFSYYICGSARKCPCWELLSLGVWNPPKTCSCLQPVLGEVWDWYCWRRSPQMTSSSSLVASIKTSCTGLQQCVNKEKTLLLSLTGQRKSLSATSGMFCWVKAPHRIQEEKTQKSAKVPL